MRLILVLLVLLAAGGTYLYFYPETGKRLLQELHETGLTDNSVRIYKWRNEKGEWQLTDTPPPAGIEYETTDYHADRNVLPVPPGIDPE
ncbi:MAG: hypothetical protein R3308_07470 [Thiohalobacterales bacterium]|nr:hypothetical protein [Thiohalobacterales bacterium]